MSEMKPVAWLYEAKAYEPGIWVKCATAYEPLAETDRRRNICPLYTSEQLAEAVAAEREQIEEYVRERGAELGSAVLSTAFVCDVIAEEIRDGIDLNNAKDIEAIRSAAE